MSKAVRPASIVISDWLFNLSREPMTPFEGAISLMNYLQDEGYYVMRPDDARALSISGRAGVEL